MPKIVSFEGCIGVGKTTLVNYFSHVLKKEKLLEEHEKNPFIKAFYAGFNVILETEITSLLIHYSQIKETIKKNKDKIIVSDFSIEKDLVYARLNLEGSELKLFEEVYNYVIEIVGVPHAVIYLDLSFEIIRRRISQRGRSYEIDADPKYFEKLNDRFKEYFEEKAQSKVFLFNVDDLVIETDNPKLSEIKEKILELI